MFKKVVVLSLSSLAASELDYSRFHLVSSRANTSSFLFRSNFPLASDGSYSYETIYAAMASRAADANLSLPSNATMLIVSLDDDFDDGVFEERLFWSKPEHFVQGRLLFWPLGAAGLIPPTQIADRKAYLENSTLWTFDALPKRVDYLNQMLNTFFHALILVHCKAGCDRTGELIGAWRMQQGYNASAAYALDITECGRAPNYYSTTALEWFCIYQALFFPETTTTDDADCTTFANCYPFGDCEPTNTFFEASTDI